MEPEAAPHVRVLVVEADAALRYLIRDLIAGEADLEIAGTVGDVHVAGAHVISLRPEALVIDLAPLGDADLPTALGLVRLSSRTRGVLLTRDVPRVALPAALQSGFGAILTRREEVWRVPEAIRSACRGRFWIDGRVVRNPQQEVGRDRCSSPNDRAALGGLDDDERTILTLVASGLSNRQIGRAMEFAESTVGHRLTTIYGKLKVQSRTEAVVEAIAAGLVDPAVLAREFRDPGH